MPDVRLYHSGTLREGRRLLTNGGRILGVTATSAESHAAAVGRAYDAAKLVDFKGCDYRKDIAHRVLDREKEGI